MEQYDMEIIPWLQKQGIGGVVTPQISFTNVHYRKDD